MNRHQRAALRKQVARLPKRLERVDLAELPSPPRHLIGAWRSRHFTVQHFAEPNGERLSVQRSTETWPVRRQGRGRPISWDELQAVKSECGLGDRWAVEIYPPEDDVVDVAPMRHLWLLPAAPSYGWRSG